MSEAAPVVIAGAGPTGLMCALALAAKDVPVELCEAEPKLTHDLRAGSFHPTALTEACRVLRNSKRTGWVMAAAWHHNRSYAGCR